MSVAESKILLCCDPLSRSLYRYNLSTGEFAYELVSSKEETKLSSELEQLDLLKGFEICDWEFDSAACETYRTRRVRTALLQKCASQHPAYFTSRDLSSAFEENMELWLKVDVSDYVDATVESTAPEEVVPVEEWVDKASAFASITFSRSQNILTIKANLVTSADEVIANMISEVSKKHGLSIQPKMRHYHLALKVSGKREYLTGNHPILAFDSVRAALREMGNLNVVLTEILKESDVFFPPIVVTQEADPMKAELEYPDILPYTLFWYPPSKLILSEPVVVQQPIKEQVIVPRLLRLSAMSSRQLSEDVGKRLLSGAELEPPIILTGECDWSFRLQISGCEKLNQLFTLGLWGTATKTGTVLPDFVVRLGQKKDKKGKHTDAQREDSNSESEATMKKAASRANRKPRLTEGPGTLWSPLSNHALDNEHMASDFANLFKLPHHMRNLRFEVMLVYGETVMRECTISTKEVGFSYNTRIAEWINFNIKISELPKEARVCINIHGSCGKNEDLIIGCTARSLFDEFGNIRTGLQALNIWPFYKIEPRLACMTEFFGKTGGLTLPKSISPGQFDEGLASEYPQIFIQFDNFLTHTSQWSLRDHDQMNGLYLRLSRSYHHQPAIDIKKGANQRIIPDTHKQSCNIEEDIALIRRKPSTSDLASLERMLGRDPLQDLDMKEKEVLFVCRDHYKTLPCALPLFLKSVDWTRPLQVTEALKVLKTWSRMEPEDALCLLDAEFADETVRLYGIRLIAQMADDELAMYMQQLVQALQFEVHHMSYLSEVLLERALRSPFVVGHQLFWALRSQLHFKPSGERFALLLEQFLMLCGRYREELWAEVMYLGWFKTIGEGVKSVDGGLDNKKSYLIDQLSTGEHDYEYPCTLSFDSRLQCKGFRSEKCKVMGSAKLPLWIEFKNAELADRQFPITDKENDPNESILRIIFKVGDDIRQDMLTLQLIRVMDCIWLANGLDLRMKIYHVTPTHDQVGLIEVVTKSTTINSILTEKSGTFGVLSKDSLNKYLKRFNTTTEKYERARENFIRSCAGWCVATYILGIGDRHLDNIMLAESGHLFHIDFGHFLGNFKSAMGIKRERTPFVFSTDMAYVMEGKDSDYFHKFTELCGKAYNQIRKVGGRFIHLFQLMTSAGMPELMQKSDIEYLRDMLSLHMTEMEASAKFRKEIDNALNSAFKTIDNIFHALNH